MSNRLTFSLASLFLIFTMAFVPTAVMAATGGPTVTLAEYSGVEAPENDPVGQTDNHEQARDDFRVRLTFSHSVAAPGAGDVKVRLRTAGVFGDPIDASAVVEVFESGGKVYVATLAAVTANTVTQAHVSIAADVVLGSTTNLLGNVGNSMTFTLPALIPATVTLELAEAKPVTGTPGRYTIVAGFTNNADGASAVPALQPPFTPDYVKVVPEGAATVFSVSDGTGDDADSTEEPWVARQVITLDLLFGTTSVNVSVDEGYIVGGNTVMVPPAETPDPVPPMAAITIEDYMLADDGEASFFIEVAFSNGDTVKPADLGVDLLDVKDSSDPAQEVELTEGLNQKNDNSYKARMTFDYDPRFLTLPLIIKVDQGEVKTSNPNHSKMVGEATSTTPMAKDPTAEIAVSGVNIGERTFTVEVMLTPGKKADGSAGDPIKGFGKDDLEIMGENDSTPRITVVDEDMADNSYLAELQWNPLSTRNLPFTVKAIRDASGDEPVYYMDTSDPTMDAMATVSADGTDPPVDPVDPTVNAPAMPAKPTASINADNDLKIDVMWTAVTDADEYIIKKYMGDTLVKTFPDDDPNTAMITASPYMVGPVPEADRGMSFTFTVTAKNAGGMSDPSPASDAVMIPMASTVANNPPRFPAGSAIKDIVIWKGHAWTSPELPAASDNHGTPGALRDDPYTTDPDLPDGLSLIENHERKVFIAGMATAASAKTPYKFIATDKLGEKVELMFNITVLDPIVPTAPTAVTAMEEGDLGGLPANLNRKMNSNKVVVNWTAPVDTTVTSHNPAIPFGAAITSYKVMQTYKEDGMVTTHPLPGTTAIKATDSSFTTPVLSVPRSKVGRGMYGFKVVAVNSVGDGAASTPAADTLVADVPHTQVNLDLRASNVPGNPNSATLDWQTPEDNGGADIVGYIIYRTLDDGPTVELKIGDVQSHRISNLDAGRHVFRVAAFNVDGLGGRSISTNFSVDVPIDPTNNLPTFGDRDIAHINATKGMAITGVTLPAATDPDNDSITYSLSPTLPTGLTFRANTRFLSGTPTAAMASTVYTYTATDANGGEASLNFTIAVKSRVVVVPPATGDLAATYANGVTTIASGMIAANGFATIGSVSLPDLEEFFDLGGTIGLSNGDATDDKNSRTVVISEILWGNDLGAPVDDQTKWQFIELYNTTGTAISVTGWTLTFTEGRPVPAIDIDQVSNRSGAGWNLDKKATHGQSGRVTGTLATDLTSAITPTNIISMYRNIDYVKVEKTYAEDNRKKQLDGFPSGNASGSWKSSERRSAYNRWIYDSKRDKHFKPTDILAASTVGHHKWFRINEIGNAAGSTNDWIELYNMTDETRSLKNYALSVVTAKGTDTRILHFHDQDWKVDKKSYVVISTRHPRDTDLAAGKDISVEDDQEENKGASHLFVVKTVDLPDDGKFTLILRNAHDKQGGDGHLEDVVATRQGAFADPNIGTSVWPLKATGLPHENVIDGGDENFAAGKVYQRNSGDGRGEKQLAVRGFTGIGYDRIAENTSVNGGTPGYDNGLIKEKIADLSDNKVSISEIMLGVGEGRQNLPQWVEIYNGSMIQAVNLNGWKLHVENSADVETALDAVLTLDSMVIPPNQTVLIVTNTGRVSDPDHFPSSRVVNLWTTKKHRDALEMIRRTDQVFSTTGFNLQLTDKDNKLVDEAGNLDGNRRTRNELDSTWTIPMNGNDDNRRSSLIRVYDAGVAVKGTMEKAWVLADETNLAYAISETYYGDPDDFGTPGFRGGGPLPVRLSKFRPERLDDGSIQIVWITESELNNAGFNILRSEKRDGEFKQINTSLIAGKGTTSERTTYTRVDTSAKPNVVYYYQIQDVSFDGKVTTVRQSRLKGNVSAAGKLTTTWGELKALQ